VLVDRTGRVLAVGTPGTPGLLAITAPGRSESPGSQLEGGPAIGLQVAGSLPAAFAAQVTTVVVDAAGEVTLDLTTPVTISLGSDTHLQKKYEAAAAALAHAHLSAGAVINVSDPGAWVITPS
jgi:hypothetical protein